MADYAFACRFGSDKREEEDASKSGETLGHRIMWIWVTCASAELCASKLMPEEGRRQLKIKIDCARSCYDSPFDRTCAWLALVKKSVHETLTLMFDAAPDLMQNWEPHALIQNEVAAPLLPPPAQMSSPSLAGLPLHRARAAVGD